MTNFIVKFTNFIVDIIVNIYYRVYAARKRHSTPSRDGRSASRSSTSRSPAKRRQMEDRSPPQLTAVGDDGDEVYLLFQGIYKFHIIIVRIVATFLRRTLKRHNIYRDDYT